MDWIVSAKKNIFRRVVIYGTHGIGKSTWCACWKNPLFIRTEDGASHLDVQASPVCESFSQFTKYLIELGTPDEELPCSALVIDSADWLQKLIWSHVEDKHGVATVAAIDFGKGYAEAAKLFAHCLDHLEAIRKKGCHIVVTAHAAKSKFESVDGRSWDRWEPKLHKTANDYLQEWCDDLLFASYDVVTKRVDEGFGRRKDVGVEQERCIWTQEAPGHVAKIRIDGAPEKIGMDFEEYRQLMTGVDK